MAAPGFCSAWPRVSSSQRQPPSSSGEARRCVSVYGLSAGVRGAGEAQSKVGRRRRRPSLQGTGGKVERLWRYVLAYASGQRSLQQESLSVGYQSSRKSISD